MVVKGLEQQKMFQDLGLYTMALENLPKFKDICYGTFSNLVHEGVHEEEDMSCCTMLKVTNLPNTCSSLISCMLNGATKCRY
ncbi:uncharacterized protein TNCV_1042481 [Trichonephila clavipes]|nr:uncharacterized protein TNCV_1042481 [Trichonephila clavipes]